MFLQALHDSLPDDRGGAIPPGDGEHGRGVSRQWPILVGVDILALELGFEWFCSQALQNDFVFVIRNCSAKDDRVEAEGAVPAHTVGAREAGVLQILRAPLGDLRQAVPPQIAIDGALSDCPPDPLARLAHTTVESHAPVGRRHFGIEVVECEH